MKEIKILGPGCPKCETLAKAVAAVVQEKGIEATIEKVTDIHKIVTYGMMLMPGLVIDGQVISSGRVPAPHELEAWLTKE